MRRKFLLVLGSLLVAAFAAEGALRILAAQARRATRARAAARAPGPGGVRVVCLGDSNVFGFAVRADQAFPARLEALMNAGRADAPHRVLNLGVPGFSTLHVRLRLAEAIDDYAPAAAVVLCGVNNEWNRPAGESEWGPFGEWRLARLFRLLRARAAARGAIAGENEVARRGLREEVTREGEVDVWAFPDRARAEEPETVRRLLRRDLEGMVALASSRRVALAFATYPLETAGFARANAVIREVAGERGVPVAELAEAIARASERWPLSSLLFYDGHPKPPGYDILAALAHDALLRAAAFAGSPIGDALAVLSPERGWDRGALDRLDRSKARLRLVGDLDDPAGPWIEIEDEPGIRFRVFLAGATKPLWTGPIVQLPLEADALFLAAMRRKELEGVVPSEGRARVSLRGLLDLGPVPRGSRIFAAYGVFRERVAPGYLADVSAPVEILLP